MPYKAVDLLYPVCPRLPNRDKKEASFSLFLKKKEASGIAWVLTVSTLAGNTKTSRPYQIGIHLNKGAARLGQKIMLT